MTEGSVVTVMDEQYGWMKIQSGRLTGWVSDDYVALSGSSAIGGTASSSSSNHTNWAASGARRSSSTPDMAVIRE
ncbi:hypothetical protein JSQ80_07300 [Paenibacillus apiarius]|nr:hypothetical protein [Paenibacillus apiarius]